MKNMAKGDRLFLCATTGDELFLLALGVVRKVKQERSAGSRAKFGSHGAECRNLSGEFKILPMGPIKWRLRFLNTTSNRLDSNTTLAMQVRVHRFLSDESAAMLTKMLGEDLALREQERRFVEGERRVAMAARIARNPQLRLEAKRRWGYRCYCCGFGFEEFYGSIGKDFAIIHHVDPLGAGVAAGETSVEQVRVVCANCHNIIHRENPPVDVEQLKRRLGRKWTPWSEDGVQARI